MAATAHVNLARVHRTTGDIASARSLLEQTDRWYRASGGGDGALLTRSLLASMPAPDNVAGAGARLDEVLAEARRDHDREVEVLTLDALARAAAERGDVGRAAQLLQRGRCTGARHPPHREE